ncbi:ribokinase [Amaricoccus solimangrovi]|uniref:Ribokinase n=1 Tax=Amaricoccus solimangrovi TaxID=2589815 RepID=A0A501WV76_9RHOB|nr:ribokinase [Amaricoccus solimangrovi]TPE52024.1 ribokinase [Amaricoccus solimangrovi]
MAGRVVVLGVFNADTTYRAERMPRIGETLRGLGFALGPGGKGSNQAVAAGRLGAEVTIITRLGKDAFAEMALDLWRGAGVTPAVTRSPEGHTGAAFIFVEAATGDNAIIIAPGAAAELSPADLDANAATIRAADVFLTQLEQPLAAAARGLALAREAGVATILNPAPGRELPADLLRLCDYVTPNETEAEAMTGIAVADAEGARAAADALLGLGAGAAVITLGERGVFWRAPGIAELVPAMAPGPVAETVGAGDAFNGGFATGLARGLAPREALRFASAVAGISVTRPGAAASMPVLAEVEALLARG